MLDHKKRCNGVDCECGIDFRELLRKYIDYTRKWSGNTNLDYYRYAESEFVSEFSVREWEALQRLDLP